MDTAVGISTPTAPSTRRTNVQLSPDNNKSSHDDRQNGHASDFKMTKKGVEKGKSPPHPAPGNVDSGREDSFWSAWSPAVSNTRSDKKVKLANADIASSAVAQTDTVAEESLEEPSSSALTSSPSSALQLESANDVKSVPPKEENMNDTNVRDLDKANNDATQTPLKGTADFEGTPAAAPKPETKLSTRKESANASLSSLDTSQLRSKLKAAVRKLKESRTKQKHAEERIAWLENELQGLEKRLEESKAVVTPSEISGENSAQPDHQPENSEESEAATSIKSDRSGASAEALAAIAARNELEEHVSHLKGQVERLQRQYSKDKQQYEHDFREKLALESNCRVTEVESLKMTITELKAQITRLEADVAERDSKVAAIVEEGMGWSRREEKQSRMNKKLRERLQKSEAEKDDYLLQIETLNSRLTSLQEEQTADRAQADTLKQDLKEAKLASDKLAKSEAKIAELEASLHNERVLASERLTRIANLEESHELAKIRGVAIEKGASHAAALTEDLDEARKALTQVREDAAAVETRLQSEIKSLHSKWQKSETRNEELADQVSSSTRPLLRQISALQKLLEEQRSIWQISERTLTQRAVKAENDSARSSEKQRAKDAEIQSLKVQLTRCEERLRVADESSKSDKQRILSKITHLETQLKTTDIACQDAQQRLGVAKAEWESEKGELERKYKADITELKESSRKRVEILSRTLEEERGRGEKMRTKIEELETNKSRYSNTVTKIINSSNSSDNKLVNFANESVTYGGTFAETGDGENLTSREVNDKAVNSMLKLSVGVPSAQGQHESQNNGQSSISSFHLERQAKARESSWRTRCLEAESSREAMAAKLCELGNVETKFNVLQEQHNNLLQRQETLLVMLGEKADRVEELESDILEVKRVYRQLADKEFT